MTCYMNDKEKLENVVADMRRRTASHVTGGFTTDMGPDHMLLDADIYRDPERFEKEMESIFGKLPLLACFSSDIPDPGSTYLFKEIGPEIIITRNKKGEVSAFLNVCAHRGAALITDSGDYKRFSCPFHGWTFDLSGELIGLPGESSFQGMQKKDRALVRVPCEEWNGLVFVKITGEREDINVEDYLASLAPQLSLIDFNQFVRVKSDRLDVEANWKTALDTYLECYHFADLHRDGLGQLYMSNVMIHDAFEPHCRLVYTSKEYLEYAHKPESEWPAQHYEGVHLLFPNTILTLNNLNGELNIGTYRLFPNGSVGKAFSVMTTYAPRELPEGSTINEWIDGHDFVVNTVSTEDYVVARTAWRNLSMNPNKTTFVLGRNEVAIQNFERTVAKHCGMSLD